MADILNDIRNFITTSASVLADLGATVCYISHEKDTPDNCITLYPYGGRAPEPNSKYKYNSSVQVRVRGTTFPKAYNTCQTIINQMHYNGDVLASTNGMMYSIQSAPIFLVRDDERRSICVCNFDARHVRY